MACKNCSNEIKIRTEEEKKNLINRINRISGQLNGVKKMIDEDRYCNDILIQLSAIDKSIRSLSNIILENHMHSCLVEKIEKGNLEVIDEVIELIRRFQ